jgi:hypothetical protein
METGPVLPMVCAVVPAGADAMVLNCQWEELVGHAYSPLNTVTVK